MNVVIIGANSEVAQAFVEELITQKEPIAQLTLLTSDVISGRRFAKHIQVKYEQDADLIPCDLMALSSYDAYRHLHPDLLFCAAGYLGKDSATGLHDQDNTHRTVDINYARLIPLLTFFAQDMEQRQSGQIIVLSSVAGERGRQSNFIYGSAKAGMTAFLSGLRNYLYPKHVKVMSVIPGFMNTKMTAGMQLNPMLTIGPKVAGETIYRAWKKGKDVVYIKWMWKWVMMIIRNIPEFIFKKMKL